MLKQLLKKMLLCFLTLLILLCLATAAYGQAILPIAIPYIVLSFLPYVFLLMAYSTLWFYLIKKNKSPFKYALPSLPFLILFFLFRESGRLEISSFFSSESLRVPIEGTLLFALVFALINYFTFRNLFKT